MKIFGFWVKTFLLFALMIASLWYITVIGIFEYLTGAKGSQSGLYWIGLLLHLVIILVCILYPVAMIRKWWKVYRVGKQ